MSDSTTSLLEHLDKMKAGTTDPATLLWVALVKAKIVGAQPLTSPRQ